MMKCKGFTLVELMIVVAIICIICAVAIPKFSKSDAPVVDPAVSMRAFMITLYPDLRDVGIICPDAKTASFDQVSCTGAGTTRDGQRLVIKASCGIHEGQGCSLSQ